MAHGYLEVVDIYASIVSTAAFLLAAAIAIVQVYRHLRWERPVLAVSGMFGLFSKTESNGLSEGEYSWSFTVDLTNIGEVAARVLDVYWEVELGDGVPARVRGTDFPDHFELETLGPIRILQGMHDPAIPLTLGKLEAVSWEFLRTVNYNPLIEKAIQGRPAVAYIARTKQKNAIDGQSPYLAIAAGEWRPMDTRKLKAEFGASQQG